MPSGAVNHEADYSEVLASSGDSIASWPPLASSEVSPSASPSSMIWRDASANGCRYAAEYKPQ